MPPKAKTFRPRLKKTLIYFSTTHCYTMSSHLRNVLCVSNQASTKFMNISPFLLPCLQTQRRAASILSSLSDNPGAYNKKIRRGRGPSSGKGKTAGRGYGGQKARGKVPFGFNGGQTKLEVVHGIRGFVNVYVSASCHCPRSLS